MAVDPDGVLPEHGQDVEKRRAKREARRARRRLLWALRDAVRAFFGMRRRPKARDYTYRTEQEARALAEEEPGALRRAGTRLAAALLFAIIALVVVWAYGAFVGGPPRYETEAGANLALRTLAALETGDLAGAHKLKDEATRLRVRDPLLDFARGSLAAADGGPAAQQMQQLAEQAKAGQRPGRRILELAGYLAGKGDAAGAAALLEQAVTGRPRDASLRLVLASHLNLLGRWEDVIRQADEYERLGGAVPLACRLRGRAYLFLGRPANARTEFEAALGYGNVPQLRLDLAEALTQLGQYPQALQHVRTVLAMEPANADAYLASAIIMEKLGRLQQAEADYRRTLALAPKHVKALNNIAYLLCESRDKPTEALPYAEAAFRLTSDVPAVMDTLGRTKYRLGRHAEALVLLRKAHAGAPDSPDIALHLAEALLAGGDRAAARPLLQRVAANAMGGASRTRAGALLRQLDG